MATMVGDEEATPRAMTVKPAMETAAAAAMGNVARDTAMAITRGMEGMVVMAGDGETTPRVTIVKPAMEGAGAAVMENTTKDMAMATTRGMEGMVVMVVMVVEKVTIPRVTAAVGAGNMDMGTTRAMVAMEDMARTGMVVVMVVGMAREAMVDMETTSMVNMVATMAEATHSTPHILDCL